MRRRGRASLLGAPMAHSGARPLGTPKLRCGLRSKYGAKGEYSGLVFQRAGVGRIQR